MKILICDDIREYRQSIRCYVEEFFKQKLMPYEIYEFSSGEEIESSHEKFDIAFLDIELGGINGIEVAKLLQRNNKNVVVLIVTSHSQYLDDAMDIHAVRYINKPTTQERIFAALEKTLEEINGKIITLNLKNNQVLRTKACDVVYVEAKFKKVIINTTEGRYTAKDSLKSLSHMFISDYFAVPHNSYIVNLNYVKDFKREEITLMEPYNNEKISVATRKQSEFRRKFLDFIGGDIGNG